MFLSASPERTSGQAPSALPTDVRLGADLPYAGTDDVRQGLDLYWHPEAEAPTPLVVCIHGGGWRQGSKAGCRGSAQPLLERGYAVAAVNYRLGQHATFPAQIIDLKAAVRWLRAHATEHNLDADRFGAWGGSAGGHLAALLGTAGDVEAWDVGDYLDQSSRVQAVVDRYGPTDFLRMNDQPGRMDHDAADSPESQLVGGPIQAHPERARRANPITYVTPDDPPFLIMHGKRDELVPYQQSELLHAALDSAGVTSELILVDSLGHGGVGWRLLVPDVVAFFDQHLSETSDPETAAGGASGLPRLRVSESGRGLVTERGEPFFWLGDTAWKLFVQLDRDEADKYLWDRKNKQFTVIQAHLLGWATDEANAYGEAPFTGGDFDRPNEAYWRHADYVINRADSLGLYLALLPAWGRTYVDDHRGNDAPRPLSGEPEKAYRYARWLGERYGDKTNVIWVLGGDVRPERHAIYERMAQGLADGAAGGDHDRVLMSYHPPGGTWRPPATSTGEFYHEQPWLDFNMLQSGHRVGNRNYERIAEDYARTPAKPTLDSEPGYEAHPVLHDFKNGQFEAWHLRRRAYWSILAGAFGYTYGANGIWQMDKPGDVRKMTHHNHYWYDAIHYEGAYDMAHVRALFESRPALDPARVPDQGLIRSGEGDVDDRVQCARAADGSYAMCYLTSGDAVTLGLSRMSGEEAKAWWYSPRDGHLYDAEGRRTSEPFATVEAGGERRFDPPGEAGAGRDWVLVLDDASAGYPPPGRAE